MSTSSINLGLPAVPITSDKELFAALVPIYNSIRNVMSAVDSYTGSISLEEGYWSQAGAGRIMFGANSKLYLQAGENLVQGNTVGIKSDGKIWKATSTGVPFCIGFATAAATTGNYVEVQMFGLYPTLPASSLTKGAKYYQTTTAGVIGTSGTQVIGFAISDTQLFFNPQL